MKKFFKRTLALALSLVLFGSMSVFAEVITDKEDFYDDWIVGSWEFTALLNQGEGVEEVNATVDIYGCEEDSDVEISNEEGTEVLTLSDYLDYLFAIRDSAGMTSSEFESYKDVFAAMGFELYGDLDWHVSDDYDQISFMFGMDLIEAEVSVSIDFTKLD